MGAEHKIEFSPYVLVSRGSLNAVSVRREFAGALIRVNGGVGCLHPWPEFGDAPVAEQLRILGEGGTSKVIERALRMATVDGRARREGVNLSKDLTIPACHYSWDHHQDFDAQIQRVITENWRAIKTKGSKNFPDTQRWLERVDAAGGRAEIGLRVDFNSCLTETEFNEFLTSLPESVRARLDFVEDPFPYDAVRWAAARQRHGIRLALDKQLLGAVAGFDVAVLKPGRREWRELVAELPPEAKVVMTSAMDHAIGQSFAAYEAAMAFSVLGDRLDLCGLCTEHLFEPDAFFRRLKSHGGQLQVDRSGTGLGFDEVLKGIDWQSLN